MKKTCILHSAGRIDYETALSWQKNLVQRLKESDSEPNHLILLEHPPVVTIGRRGTGRNIIADEKRLKQEGVKIFHTNRGGDVTYHGPGQIVGYPIIRLSDFARDIGKYLRAIEEVVIRTLKRFDIEGERKPKYTGVWVGEEKICAIGVAISRWITSHGWALNVNSNLSHFDLIIPCGISGKRVTSIRKILGGEMEADEVREALVESFAGVFRFEILNWEESACPCKSKKLWGMNKPDFIWLI